MFCMLHCSFYLNLRFIYLCCDKVYVRKLLLLCVILFLIVFSKNPHKVKSGSQIFNIYGTVVKWGKAMMSVHYSPDIVKAKINCGHISTVHIMRI